MDSEPIIRDAIQQEESLLNLPETTLKHEIRKSRIELVGVTDGIGANKMREVLENSRGCFLFKDFLEKLGDQSTEPPFDFIAEHTKGDNHPVVLGIDDIGFDHEAGAYLLGSHPWPKIYEEFKIDPTDKDHTNKYMTAISDRIMMYVVPNIAKRVFRAKDENGKLQKASKNTETYDELKWIVEHPEVLGNVIFLFGGQDHINDEHPTLKRLKDEPREMYQVVGNAYDIFIGKKQKQENQQEQQEAA